MGAPKIVFNSKEFAWAECSIFAGGRKITGIRGFEYGVRKEKELLHAAGEEPQSVQHGNKEYFGSLDLLQSEEIAFQKFAEQSGGDDITDIDFDLVCTYAPKLGLPLVTDIVKFASVTEDKNGMKQGAKFMEVSLPFVAVRVLKNVSPTSL